MATLDNIELKIIKRGLRPVVYKTRNAGLILFGTALPVFLIGIAVTSETSPWRDAIAFIPTILITTLTIVLLSTIILLYKPTIGNIIIMDSDVAFTNKAGTIKLRELKILLNSDTFEFENVKKKTVDLYKIVGTGNRIASEDLPPEQNEWELILTKESKQGLLGLTNKRIVLAPQFESRPVLMESPERLLRTIAEWGRGWN